MGHIGKSLSGSPMRFGAGKIFWIAGSILLVVFWGVAKQKLDRKSKQTSSPRNRVRGLGVDRLIWGRTDRPVIVFALIMQKHLVLLCSVMSAATATAEWPTPPLLRRFPGRMLGVPLLYPRPTHPLLSVGVWRLCNQILPSDLSRQVTQVAFPWLPSGWWVPVSPGQLLCSALSSPERALCQEAPP